MGIVIAAWIVFSIPKPVCKQYPLKALAVSKELNGSMGFFLGIGGGSIGSRPEYYYFMGEDDGGYRMHSKDIWQVKIFEEDVKSPWGTNCDMETKLHIPKGSIIENYQLDINKL